MSSLTSSLSSDYQRAANTLRSKFLPKEILVRVEGVEDVSFWHGILESYQKDAGVKFDIQPYSNSSLTTGKQELAKSFNLVGSDMIICLDSDYDYLLPECSDVAKFINQSPYIFQTYSYAIENLKCYAESLAGVCVQATHCTSQPIDLATLLDKYSEIIYELFIWNVYFASLSDTTSFTISQFCDAVKLLKSPNIPDSGCDALDLFKTQVNNKLLELQQTFPVHVSKITLFAKELEKSELTKNNCYLFANGHVLYENFVLMFLKPIFNHLKKENIQRINESTAQQKQKIDEIKKYQNSVQLDIKSVLSRNQNFRGCFLYKKIEQDIASYLTLLKSA